MKDIQKIKEFFSKPLKEVSGNIDIEDFNKVVQAIQQTNYPVTVMLTSMFGNEIEIIVGIDAPDSLIDAISDIMDDLGYNSNRDYSIAGDSSTLSRRQYDEIRRINGGHKDYYRESVSKEKYYVAYNGKGFYGITTKSSDKIEGEYSKEEAEKIAAEKNKSLKEIDINDPVLMKARAAAFQRTQPKPEPVKTINPNYKAVKNADKIKALQIRRTQLMRDMEQEAEPEGGPIANRYGDMLNKIDKAIAMLSEAKTAVDMAKKRLDALGVKYEMSTTDKVRPFKVIYKPVNKSDKFYDEFEDIVDLFNLKGFVKSSMDEAKKEDAVDTITMDIPLFLRMLEYSREDASQDMDLHDVTEKANKLGKERGILSMEDYEEIVGAAEDIKEAETPIGMLNRLNPNKSLKVGDITTFSSGKYKGKKVKIVKDLGDGRFELEIVGAAKDIKEAELTEAYVPSNIKEFAKRKGVLPLVNKVAGWAEKVGARITGGTAIGYNYSTLVLDMEYQGSEIRINTDNDTVTLYDEPVNSFPEFKSVYDENNGTSGNNLEERIAEALNKINEELCPAGKAYIKRRKAAGEKSSAYLSGRAVKVCKGQMSGKAKKKK